MKKYQIKKKSFKKWLIVILILGLIIVFYNYRKSLKPCFSQKFVEEYVSQYSKDFTFLYNKTGSIGVVGTPIKPETDWYFHDNELNFDFHVKTLIGAYPPKQKHIACNFYDTYFEKLNDRKCNEIKEAIINSYSEIYNNIDLPSIDYYSYAGGR